MAARARFIGWLLFLLCSFFYLGAGIRDRDKLIIVGSLLFLAAVVIFLVFPEK